MEPKRSLPAFVFAMTIVVGVGDLAPARAMALTVTRFDDPTPGPCDPSDCSLREAIVAANVSANPDTIELSEGVYALTIPGTGEELSANGDLDVRTTVDIVGKGMTSTVIDGNGSVTGERVFHLPSGAFGDLALTGLTVQRGGNGNDAGGGILTAPGTSLDLLRVSVLANNAGTGDGGGIDNSGAATLIDSRVGLNPSSDEGGGIFSAIPATLTLDRVTIDHNAATRSGGGVFMDGDALSMTNVTISANSAGEDGGGMDVGAGPTTLNNVTVTGNTADLDGNDNGDGGGVFGNQITVRNSIIAGNHDASGTGGDVAPDCSTTMSGSAGHNIIGVDQGCGIAPSTSDLYGTTAAPLDPKLGALADNGGPTMTHALLPGSPAIDAAGGDAAPIDQRGLLRNPDIGAYELVLCAKVPVNRFGTESSDTITGTAAPDGMLGLGGKDKLSGLGGNDGLCGGGGKDTLKGGGGKDRLRGEAGKDTCLGGGGKDKAVCETEKKVP